MPKLKHRPPKYAKLKNYAVVYLNGKTHYLGLYGSEESKIAYARFVAENRINPFFYLPKTEEPSTTVRELAAAFLDHVKPTANPQNYHHHRTVVADFLLKFYGDTIPVDDFKPSNLKLVRNELIRSGRFCRKMINDYIRRIVAIFTWGVEEELVQPNTAASLKVVKALQAGYPGTYDHEEREAVPDEVIRRTLPFMVPMIRAMVRIQRLTGMRPSEVFNMRVGEIDRATDPDLWLYRLSQHKTEKKTGRKKVIPLGKPEQELIAPYLVGKVAEKAVFSPETAAEERKAQKGASSKTKTTSSRAAKPREYKEFFDKDTYRKAVEYAINKGNKTLPESGKIPKWTPYQLRHQAATAMEQSAGLDEAQALLDHSSAETTKRYAHGRLEKLKELARNRVDLFDDSTEQEDSAARKAS